MVTKILLVSAVGIAIGIWIGLALGSHMLREGQYRRAYDMGIAAGLMMAESHLVVGEGDCVETTQKIRLLRRAVERKLGTAMTPENTMEESR